MMSRESPNVWSCEHPLPIVVVPLGNGRQARCLRGGQCSPVRPDSEGAMRALKEAAGHRLKMGA